MDSCEPPTMWVLGIRPRFCARATSALNNHLFSPCGFVVFVLTNFQLTAGRGRELACAPSSCVWRVVISGCRSFRHSRNSGPVCGECFRLLLSVGCQLSGMTSAGSDPGLSQMSVTCITRQSRFKHILQHWDGEVAAPFETAA